MARSPSAEVDDVEDEEGSSSHGAPAFVFSFMSSLRS